MNRYIIGSLWDRDNRNGTNKNFEYLFEGRRKIDELNIRADKILNEAKRTNDMNKDVQKQVDDLILKSGQSDAEVINARGEYSILRERLDDADKKMVDTTEELNKTYSSSENFQPIVIAKSGVGRHTAFGSIDRAMDLSRHSLLNKNLAVWRNGANHQSDGKIEGVYVSDTGYAIGEPFIIAEPAMYQNIGRGGTVTPNDFRDPNILRLSNGNLLLTFFAIHWEKNRDRSATESYAMIATFNEQRRTLDWSAPSLISPEKSDAVYGKPVEEAGYIYTATYTAPLDPNPSVFKGKILRASINNPLNWSEIGEPFFEVSSYRYFEPIFRFRPNGGYFVQARHDGSNSIVRFDSDNLESWTEPNSIYTGSRQAKGLEVLEDGSYFTGIRLNDDVSPGVGILTSKGSAGTSVDLKLSGVPYTSVTGSAEAGYLEFMNLGGEKYLGLFHTEEGSTIQCFSFTLAMIVNKEVKKEVGFPNQKPIGAERFDPSLHVGEHASRNYNLLQNPLLYTPYGFSTPPYWSGITVAESTSADPVGSGYAKITTAGGTLRNKLKRHISRVFFGHPFTGAARIYCRAPDRVNLILNYGGDRISTYHNGTGWETIPLIFKNDAFISLRSLGGKGDDIEFRIRATTGSEITFYIDWATFGFGETIPEVMNESVDRLTTLARVTLSSKENTFLLEDLGLPSPSIGYTPTILNTSADTFGYKVSTNSLGFTITLSEGSQWGSSNRATLQILGI